jgi:hypothetical protein
VEGRHATHVLAVGRLALIQLGRIRCGTFRGQAIRFAGERNSQAVYLTTKACGQVGSEAPSQRERRRILRDKQRREIQLAERE